MSNEECSIKFCSPTTIAIFGCTLSGKTVWTKKLVEQSTFLFTEPVCNTLYCYGMYQGLFENMLATIPGLQIHAGLPAQETLQNLASNGKHNLVVLDDLQADIAQSPQIEKLFTQLAHHLNLSVVFLAQNLFYKNFSRTITMNSHIIVLFKNARDAQQICCLGRQLYPLKWREFVNAYLDSTSKPYGYIIVDLSPQSNDQVRLRSLIFKGEDPIVYKL